MLVLILSCLNVVGFDPIIGDASYSLLTISLMNFSKPGE